MSVEARGLVSLAPGSSWKARRSSTVVNAFSPMQAAERHPHQQGGDRLPLHPGALLVPPGPHPGAAGVGPAQADDARGLQDGVPHAGEAGGALLPPQHRRTRGTPLQISPEQGAFLSLLVRVSGARRCIEVGTFTGYSSIAVASALPQGGRVVCCDVDEPSWRVAQEYWGRAGVEDKARC